MSMVIAHNIPALQTYNIVNNTSNALQKSIAKLSSGLRINSAADDAAGLAISEKMRSQIRGLDRAVANTQDGISMIQTAEGALSETHSILQRMRELSVQAANDTLTQQDRAYIQEEVDQLKDEITRVGNTTQFNKKKLLNGDSSALWSSSDLETKALVRGSLRDVDQFGQKKSVEGNYKIRVKADPGQAEVQKSDIMTIKHPNVLTDKTVNTSDGIKDVQVDNMTPGEYDLKLDTAAAGGAAVITGSYGIGGTVYEYEQTGSVTFGAIGAAAGNAVTKIEITDDNGNVLDTWGDGTSTLIANSTGADDVAATVQGHTFTLSTGSTLTLDVDTTTASKVNYTLTDYGTSNLNGISFKFYTGGTGATAGTSTITPSGGGTPTKTGNTQTLTADSAFTVTSNAANTKNGSVLFEVLNRDESNKTLTLKATATMLDQSGKNSTATMDNIVIKEGGTADLKDLFGTGGVTVALSAGAVANIEDSGKFVAFVTAGVDSAASGTGASATTTSVNLNLSGKIDKDWDDTWDNGPFGVDATTSNPNELSYLVNADALTDTEVHLKNFILNEKTGTVTEGDVIVSTNDDFTYAKLDAKSAIGNDTLANFTTSYIGKTANGDVRLRDLDKFWNSEGTFMLDDAKTLTLNQGNGKTANITLYANDTLDEVATKINNAIATDLGQSKYVDDATKFATFVSEAGNNNFASEAVPGTFVIRSVVPGAQGEITFSGDQQILDALSLNTIQESKETRYSVDVLDEHSGKVLAQNVKTTGNVLHGVIHENVDVEFSALSGVSATWNDNLKKFTYDSEMQETTLHLADNTTVLQIGANEGEDLAMDIGDMRAHALGLDGVNMMSHDRAARSITVIDNAIDKVSTQRAKLGAYQNRLEYTANNLTTASENLTSAESRIRDADMAKEMMEFTKLNIMLQAGNSMLAQANQQPQNVLSLIR